MIAAPSSHDICQFDIPEGLIKIPVDIDVNAYEADIQIWNDEVEQLPGILSKATWITCRQASPHQDAEYIGMKTITLAVMADHSFGEISGPGTFKQHSVFKGSLFVVNNRALHWLSAHNLETTCGFIGLQWNVEEQNAEAEFARIRNALSDLMPIRATYPAEGKNTLL